MTELPTYAEIKQFLFALAWTQPRILAMTTFIPIFNRQLMPGMLRYAILAAIGLILVPMILPRMAEYRLDTWGILGIITKEIAVGFMLGFIIAIPFWGFEAMGFIIDNQRGASVAATLNPLTGNDSSPLGIMFGQAFMVYFFVTGGFLIMLKVLYDSFVLWDIFTWMPTLSIDLVPLIIRQFSNIMEIAVLLGAPAIIAMFLSEVGLALVSRFAPQLQVFFLAMPIKCAVAILVLLIYMPTLADYTLGYIRGLHDTIPLMQKLLGYHR